MSDEFKNTLQKKIAALKKSQMPKRDLWLGIEMAVLKEKHRNVPQFAIAASIVIFVACGWLLLSSDHVNSNQTDNLVAKLDASHQHQMISLKAAYKNMHPLTNNLNQQLQEMDRAANAVKQALKDDPDNVTLLNMLTGIYQTQISLIEHVYQPDLQNPDLI